MPARTGPVRPVRTLPANLRPYEAQEWQACTSHRCSRKTASTCCTRDTSLRPRHAGHVDRGRADRQPRADAARPRAGAIRHADRPSRAAEPAGARRDRRRRWRSSRGRTPTSRRPGMRPSGRPARSCRPGTTSRSTPMGTVEFFDDRGPAARHRHPADRAAGDGARRALGGERRAGRLHRGDAEGHRRLRAADRAPRGQVEDEPEPSRRGSRRGGCRAGRRRGGRTWRR